MKHKSNIFLTCFMAVLLFSISCGCYLKKTEDFSETERRMLASFPKLTAETLLSGKFMQDLKDPSLIWRGSSNQVVHHLR